METNKILVQKLKKDVPDNFALAEKYYAILSDVNSLGFTQREIQLVAYTAVNGNISYKHLKEEFCKKYKTTVPTINNIISKLKKIGVFIKKDGKIKVNPVIVLDFNKDIVLAITLTHE
jgi:hypothetical protein